MITPPWRILRYRDYPCLLCLMCNSISHNPNDIKHTWCQHCQLFLTELPEMLRQDQPEGRAPGLLLESAEYQEPL